MSDDIRGQKIKPGVIDEIHQWKASGEGTDGEALADRLDREIDRLQEHWLRGDYLGLYTAWSTACVHLEDISARIRDMD